MRLIAFIESNPPDSLPTDISLSQYLAIQEKGVSAWEFEPELEIANCFVEARTEIEFFDSECCVLSNLPVPKQNEVYYWESKIYDKPEQTMISIGMATKPYPLFRLPGKHPQLLLSPTTPPTSSPISSRIQLTPPRLAQILRSLHLHRPTPLQPTLHTHLLRPPLRPRRRHRRRLPPPHRHPLLHPQRQETRRRRPRPQIPKPLPRRRRKRALHRARQLRAIGIRVYRS